MPIPVVQLTRKQLYDEIWDISASRVAKKYDIPYSQLLKQIKAANIPIPPSGYWTKVELGKPVDKPALTEPLEEIVLLTKCPPQSKVKLESSKVSDISEPSKAQAQISTSDVISSAVQKQPSEKNIQEVPVVTAPIGEPETFQQYGQTYNVYDRETLYQEVWSAPVIEVAKKYKVSDVSIHKVCKSLGIPTPPLGYWAKLRAGKPVMEKPPLSKSDKEKTAGIQTGCAPAKKTGHTPLAFLDDEERAIVMAVAEQIQLPDENARMHPTIIAHRKALAAWKAENAKNVTGRWRPHNAPSPPFLADTISDASIPRVCRIIDGLIKAMEPLGCTLTEHLLFTVNGETIGLYFSESKDKAEHVPTKEENRQLLVYEDERKKHSYASKPQIRKYDYVYNGRLSLGIGQSSFRDCRSYQLEDRLGDMMVALYEASEAEKQRRLIQEEAARRQQEEMRKKEERRKRYNEEVDKTLALANIADDYNTACKIRTYISAYQAAHSNEDISAWLAWATAKADWYDPIISREDEFLGIRDHAKGKEEKTPSHTRYWW